jgi:hypothetical protein
MAALSLDLAPDALDALAERLADLVLVRLREAQGHDDDRWMDSQQAAAYLGLSLNALHKRTAARAIPFGQDSPGAKCWFLRSELDRWRREGGHAAR